MGSFARVSMEVDLSRRGSAAEVAREVVETFPGTRNVTLDRGNGDVRFEIRFPGNLSALVGRLRSSLIPVGDRASVSLPVRSVSSETLENGELVARTLEEGPEIWDVEFARGQYVLDARVNGDCVEASIVPTSQSMHQLYDSLLKLGLLADEVTPPLQDP